MTESRSVLKLVLRDLKINVFYTRCKRNCGATVNPAEGLLLEAHIESLESLNNIKARYQWNVYNKIEQGGKLAWTEFKATDATTINQIHLQENTLQPGRSYKVSVVGLVHGRTNGYSELIFSVNIPPRDGSCFVDKPGGYSDETTFLFECEGWVDEDLPLSYEFLYYSRHGVVFLLHDGITPAFFTKLPVGDADRNFTLDFQVKVSDAHGTYNTTKIDVQVCK